jgi:hypothetical protein
VGSSTLLRDVLSIVPGGTSGRLPKMRRFDWFQVAKKEKDQTTSDNDQNTADPN